MLKHGLTIGPLGNVRPCCKFNNSNIDLDFYGDWRELFDSYHERSKTEWLTECNECRIAEDEDKYSFRQYANETLGAIEHGIGYWDLKINNTCNLACVMCNPVSSSSWMQQVENNSELEWPRYIKYNTSFKKPTWYKNFMPAIREQLYDAKHVKFTGGEPFMIPQVREIIDWLCSEDIAPSVQLTLITNGSYSLKQDLRDQLAKFKHVTLMTSIDSIGTRYEYIRKGANWSQLEKNIDTFLSAQQYTKNMSLQSAYLPMSINARYKNDTQQWATQRGLDFIEDIEIQRPQFLGYSSLPMDLRDRYGITTETEFKQEHLDRMIKYMKLQDNIHGTDFETECSEFINDK